MIGLPPFDSSQSENDHPRASSMTRASKAIKEEYKDAREAFLEAYVYVKEPGNYKGTVRRAFRRKYWGWWIGLVVVVTLSSVLSSYHSKIALAIQPYRHEIRARWWSWIVPTILLIIVSFPPLFGHELIILAVGLIWGLGLGFAIACLGTFVGELATYVAFKYFFRRKALSLERKNITYACLAKLMRDGGWKMVTLVRFSAVPGHVTTAIQSTIGIGIYIFAVACVLSLPKQFALVYIGVLLGRTGNPTGGDHTADNSHHRITSLTVLFVTGIASAVAAYIIWMRMRRIRPFVEAEMAAVAASNSNSTTNTNTSEREPNLVASVEDVESQLLASEEPSEPKDITKTILLGTENPEASTSSATLPRYRSRSGTMDVDVAEVGGGGRGGGTAAPSYRSSSKLRSEVGLVSDSEEGEEDSLVGGNQEKGSEPDSPVGERTRGNGDSGVSERDLMHWEGEDEGGAVESQNSSSGSSSRGSGSGSGSDVEMTATPAQSEGAYVPRERRE